MSVANLLRAASFVLVALPSIAISQATPPLFPSDTIPYSGCYAMRCFESVRALDRGTAVAALRPLVTVSVRGPVGWIKQQDILNPDIKPPRSYQEGERRSWPPFASAIGLSGNELLIAGSSSKYNFKDVVYVFSRANGVWTHTQTLALLRPAAFEQTIVSHIAIDRGMALIAGTRYDDQDPSAAFVQIDIYVRTAPGQWKRRGSFKPPAGVSDEFPASMDLDGNFALFGDPAARGAGRAYLFEYASGVWSLRRTFAPAASATNSRFGSNVALSGDAIAITAPEQPTQHWYQKGAVYMFPRTPSPSTPARIIYEPSIEPETPPDEQDVRTFGTSIAIDGPRAIVGVQGGAFVDFQPHAYLLEPYPMWRIAAQLVNYEALFSGAVFVSGSTAVVEGGQEWGDRAGYVFELPLIGELP